MESDKRSPCDTCDMKTSTREDKLEALAVEMYDMLVFLLDVKMTPNNSDLTAYRRRLGRLGVIV